MHPDLRGWMHWRASSVASACALLLLRFFHFKLLRKCASMGYFALRNSGLNRSFLTGCQLGTANGTIVQFLAPVVFGAAVGDPSKPCLSLTRLPVGAFIGNTMQNTENARRFVHLARTSTISSLNPNESSPGRAGKALEKRETERVSGSGWRVAHTRRAGGRVSQSRKGLRSWAG